MKRTESFMGRKFEVDPVAYRANLEECAEAGLVTPQGYWANLRASWHQMTDADKLEELDRLR
jgi:hypothetical protein